MLATDKFTGKERDTETGLDYFGARYYGSNMGRFTSPDSTAYSSLKYPQAWNLYAYTLNNPLRFTDPTGNAVECKKNDSRCLADAQKSVGKEAADRVYLDKKTETAPWYRRMFGQQTITRTFIGIKGDITSFKNLGANANKLADLVTDKRVITITYDRFARASGWDSAIDLRGGGSQAFVPSQGYDPQVFIDPSEPTDQRTVDTDAEDAGIPQANSAERFGHELLGHVWAELYGNTAPGTPLHKAYVLHSENEVRKTDPSRGTKPSYHD